MWDLFATCHGKSVLGRLIFQGQMHLVAMIPHRNAAAAAVSFSNCDSHGLPPLDLVFRVLLPTIAIDATPIMVFF